jgi:hypothetical protein
MSDLIFTSVTEILLLNIFPELLDRNIFKVNLILHWFCCTFSGPETFSDNAGFPFNSPSQLDGVHIVCKIVYGCQCQREPKQLSQYGDWLYDGGLELISCRCRSVSIRYRLG